MQRVLHLWVPAEAISGLTSISSPWWKISQSYSKTQGQDVLANLPASATACTEPTSNQLLIFASVKFLAYTKLYLQLLIEMPGLGFCLQTPVLWHSVLQLGPEYPGIVVPDGWNKDSQLSINCVWVVISDELFGTKLFSIPTANSRKSVVLKPYAYWQVP